MATAPAADQVRLLEVQQLDTRLAQIAHRRSTLPVLARCAELDERIAAARAAVGTAQAAVGDVRRDLVKAETDVEQVALRERRDQDRLTAGTGTARDLQALHSELASLARRRAELEDVQLAVMERLEGAETVLDADEGRLAGLLGERAEAGRAAAQELAVLDAQALELTRSRAEEAQDLDAGLLALYERLRATSGGVGAALLRARRCEGCRLELNAADLGAIAAAPPDAVVRCEECGRILVRTEESGL